MNIKCFMVKIQGCYAIPGALQSNYGNANNDEEINLFFKITDIS